MRLIELKSGNQVQPLQEIIEEYFSRYLKEYKVSDFLKEAHLYVRDSKITKKNYKVKPRAKIVFPFDDGVPFEHPKVALENKQIVIFDKPRGLPTQGTLRRHEDNLFERARLHYLLMKSFPGGLPYVGLHHRLDRDTSGLVLMTKQRSANKAVSDLFKERNIRKSYIAFVELGEKAPAKKWTHKCKIERGFSKRHPFIFKVGEGGDEAVSDFELIESTDKYRVIRCYPKTGRTHQIRVQLAYQGYPVLGDRLYGTKKSAMRLMLHAHKLEFNLSGEEISAESSIGLEQLREFVQ